jgi:hypothetical protein
MTALWPLVIVLTLYAALGTWLFIRTPASFWLKISLVPLLLGSAYLVLPLADTLLGFAAERPLPAKFTYLAHQVVVEKSKKVGIEVLVAGPHARLYRIPYSKRAEDALGGAKQAAKGGGRVELRKRAQQPRSDGTETEDDYESNLILPHQENPKNREGDTL